MSDKSTRIRQLILKSLHELGDSAGASKISEVLSSMGVTLQPRSIRFHLLQMDREGFTRCTARRKGRQLTDLGKKELEQFDVFRKVGYVSARVDELGFRMTMEITGESGTIIPNIAIIGQKDLSRSIHYMSAVFDAGLSIAGRIAYKMFGEQIGGVMVPRGKIALATICSMTLNSLFFKAGIPITSRFGGLLKMEDRNPVRFVNMIEYNGSTIDPMKLFILAGMTNVTDYAHSGNGVIGASFREFPSVAYDRVKELIAVLKNRHNIGGVLKLGQPNMPLLDVPVGEGRTGLIIFAGLNPFAALYEAGVPVDINPLRGVEDFRTFIPFDHAAPIGRQSIPFTY